MFNKKIAYSIILAFLLIAILPLISAVSPFQQTSSGALELETPSFDALKLGQDQRFHVHVINATSIKTNKTTSCQLHFYNSSGYDTNIGATLMEFEAYNGVDFALTIAHGNFTRTGQYAYVIQCNSTNEVGFIEGQIYATNSGEIAQTGRALIDIGLLLVLIIFLVGCVVIFMESDNLLARVGMLGLGYLLLIAISFISWNMANDFLISAPFIIEIFRIIFIVLMIGAFPLLIGAFAWYFIMLFKIKEIENLMKHGMSEQEAKERVGRRNR